MAITHSSYNPSYIVDATENFNTNLVGFSSLTIILFDHIITFSDEVEYIWKGHKSPLVLLFLLNRYLTPLGFMVNIIAYTAPFWTPERCQHFIRFEGSMTVIGLEVVGLMMLLRVYALYYSSNRWPIYLVISILVFETAMNAWLLTHGQAVTHQDPNIHACTMIFDPSLSKIASSSAWIPLLYDTVVLVLTIYKALPQVRPKRDGGKSLMRQMLADGILYFSVMFSVNVVLTLMIIFAPPGIKNITAQLELIMTVTMMSRITLSLRKAVHMNARAHRQETLILRSMRPANLSQTARSLEVTQITQDIELDSDDDQEVLPTASRISYGKNKPAWYDA